MIEHLSPSERRNTAAAAITTARQHLMRALSYLDGIEQDGYYYASNAAATCDDALTHLQYAETQPTQQEVLDRLGEIPSDYAGTI